jgi:hypothetical protein
MTGAASTISSASADTLATAEWEDRTNSPNRTNSRLVGLDGFVQMSRHSWNAVKSHPSVALSQLSPVKAAAAEVQFTPSSLHWSPGRIWVLPVTPNVATRNRTVLSSAELNARVIGFHTPS